jgi:hypothetical protein
MGLKQINRFKRLIQGLSKTLNSTNKGHILAGKKDD